jgi:hypothetical protein
MFIACISIHSCQRWYNERSVFMFKCGLSRPAHFRPQCQWIVSPQGRSVNRMRDSIDISVRDIDTAIPTENHSEGCSNRHNYTFVKKCVLEHEEIKLRHLYQNLLVSVSTISVTLCATAIGAARAHAMHQIAAMTSLARSFEGRALKEYELELKDNIGRWPHALQHIH